MVQNIGDIKLHSTKVLYEQSETYLITPTNMITNNQVEVFVLLVWDTTSNIRTLPDSGSTITDLLIQ